MSKNNIQKTLLKHLAAAPVYAAKKALLEIDESDRAEALRIISALGIKQQTKKEKEIEKND